MAKPGPITIYRLSHLLHKLNLGVIGKLFDYLNRLIFGCWVPGACTAGAGAHNAWYERCRLLFRIAGGGYCLFGVWSGTGRGPHTASRTCTILGVAAVPAAGIWLDGSRLQGYRLKNC